MGFLHLPQLGAVHYHEYGTGSKPMLAFHGYGMTGKQFDVLQHFIASKYHIYGFDHFFHGESKLENWTEEQILKGITHDMVYAYAEAWFQKFGGQRISLLAYSIGANFALLLLEHYAGLIDEIILMAPDGLAGYKGFHFLQHKPLGKMLFRAATKSKWLAPSVLQLVKRLKIIDNSLYTIAYNEIDTAKKREDVYYTLNLIKHLQPDTTKIAALINEYKINCILIFGKDDMLFPKEPAMPFIELLHNATVHHVPMGHWLVTTELDNYLFNLGV
jgi:pimeloyl-ACP methyl ester carboxylesterase